MLNLCALALLLVAQQATDEAASTQAAEPAPEAAAPTEPAAQSATDTEAAPGDEGTAASPTLPATEAATASAPPCQSTRECEPGHECRDGICSPTTPTVEPAPEVVGEEPRAAGATLPVIVASAGLLSVIAAPFVVGILALGVGLIIEGTGALVTTPGAVALVVIGAAGMVALPAAAMGATAYFVSTQTMSPEAARPRVVAAAVGAVAGAIVGGVGLPVAGYGLASVLVQSQYDGSYFSPQALAQVLFVGTGALIGWFVVTPGAAAGAAWYVDSRWPVE